MARPRQSHPTPAELEVLQVLWEEGPATVRQVMERLNPGRPRGYTSVMSLLDVPGAEGEVLALCGVSVALGVAAVVGFRSLDLAHRRRLELDR